MLQKLLKGKYLSLIPKLIFKASRLLWFVTRPITVGIRLLLIKESTVLLVRHTYQGNYWFLVGGGVKRNENLLEATRREAKEEVGATLGELKLLGMYTNYFDYKSDHVAVFVCEDFSLSGTSDNEIEKIEFFPLNNLPTNLASGHKRRILEYVGNNNNIPIVGMW